MHPQDGPDAELRIWLSEDRVRVSVRVNLVFVDHYLDVPREAEIEVAEPEFPAYREALGVLYSEALEISADGTSLSPEIGELRALPALDSMLYMFPAFGARAMSQLWLELDYEVERPPTEIAIRWSLFPPDLALGYDEDDADEAPRIAVSGQLNDGEFDYSLQFTEAESDYVWSGQVQSPAARFLDVPAPPLGEPLRVPVISLVLVAGALASGLASALRGPLRSARRSARRPVWIGLTIALLLGAWFARERSMWSTPFERAPDPLEASAALAVFEPLHRNIYTAFDFQTESEVYDALAKSVDGPLLDRLYSRIYASLVLEEEGGAVARVKDVRYLSSDLIASNAASSTDSAFELQSRWQVMGEVTHFGHSHRRTQEYAARYRVATTPAGWKIVDDEILEQTVVETQALSEDAPGPESRWPDEL